MDCYIGFALQNYDRECCSTLESDCSDSEKSFLQFWTNYGFHVCLFFFALNAALGVQLALGNKEIYWFNSFILALFRGFFGGCVAPFLIGQTAFLLSNDCILIFAVVCWALTHYSPAFVSFINKPVLKLIWVNCAMMFRANNLCNIINVTLRNAQKQGDSTYIPLIGPVIVGALICSMGSFFPLSSGLSGISSAQLKYPSVELGKALFYGKGSGGGMPWVLQGALISGIFYHLYANDKAGIFGTHLRLIVSYVLSAVEGTGVMHFAKVGEVVTLSDRGLRAVVISFWFITSSLQILYGPDFNPFYIIHKLFYKVTGFHGPIQLVYHKEKTA